MIEISFTKMSGAGNDFVVINNFNGSLNVDLHAMAKALCGRGLGIGADGILFLRKSPEEDFEMYYLNSDGSEAGMCGNGGRCIARFAVLNGIAKSPTRFVVHGKKYSAEVFNAEKVRLHFPNPEELVRSKKIPIDGMLFDATYVCAGTEHMVLTNGPSFEKVDLVDLITLGRKIRYNSEMFPRGTNVDIIERTGEPTSIEGSRSVERNEIRMRTYERGVEGETLACGTGAIASAITASIQFDMRSPVNVLTTSKETLKVSFERSGLKFSNVVLEGSARVVFQGRIFYDENSHKILDLLYGQGDI